MNTKRYPVAMATDGQGVILAAPHSVDVRQRTAMDLLTRRVSHRLGCPVATGQVQHGVLHLDAPLTRLHSKGAREIVVSPVRLTPSPMSIKTVDGSRGGIPRPTGVSLREAEPLGGAAEVIEAVVEVLDTSERTPDPTTRVVMLLPHSEHAALGELMSHTGALSKAGWLDGAVVPMPASQADCNLNGALQVAPEHDVMLVPLTIAPGPFSSRVADCAQRLGVPHASVSLHSAEALTKLICRRVTEARRA